MHGFRFLCEIALPHCSYRSGRIIHSLPCSQYGEKIGSGLVTIAQLEIINEGSAPVGKRCGIYQRYFNEENQPDIAPLRRI